MTTTITTTATVQLDWREVGEAFSDAGSTEQAAFLEGVLTGFQPYGEFGTQMQLTFIANDFRDEAPLNAAKIADLLRDLVAHLDDAVVEAAENAAVSA